MKRRGWFAFAMIAVATLTTGCSVKYKMVGKFDAYNEVIVGDLDHNLAAGVAQIQARGENSGLTCSGSSEVTHAPLISFGCNGQRGIARLQCSDGRVAQADWVAETCTNGYGHGKLEDGSSFTFTFGLSEEEARAQLATLKPQVASKPDLPGYRPKETRKEIGFSTGTGFFVSANGHLVTNYHVVEDAEYVFIQHNGELTPATLIKSDQANDVAILKVDLETTPLPLSPSHAALRAEEVFTLGYPSIQIQGQSQKATFGRINALSGIRDDIRYFQIDVPIQPGNSGGPLINKRGEVIGVVTMTLDALVTLQEQGTIPQNVNYAVKSDYVVPLLNQISGWQPSSGQPESSFTKLADKYGDSVVLVVAK